MFHPETADDRWGVKKEQVTFSTRMSQARLCRKLQCELDCPKSRCEPDNGFRFEHPLQLPQGSYPTKATSQMAR